jgi:hypothetical protein
MRRVRLLAVALLLTTATGCTRPRPVFVAGAPSSPAPRPALEAPNGERGPLGDVIGTGLRAAGGQEYVLFGVTGGAVNDSSPFGVAIGLRRSQLVITDEMTVSEYRGSASAPGFHPMQGQIELGDGSVQPAFGYYVGTPATISVVDSGHPITARLARWSHDPGVTIFWFDPSQVKDGSRWTDLGAYDGSGVRLPDGHIELFGP